MGGFMLYDKGKPVQVLTFERIKSLIEKEQIDPADLATISEEDILDKSKRDFLSKLLVVLQTSWFVVQCIGRWYSDLPLAELEISTLAFAVLNATVYGIWWNKPQGVLVAIKIPLRHPPPPKQEPSSNQPASNVHDSLPTLLLSPISPNTPSLSDSKRESVGQHTSIGPASEEKLYNKRSCNFLFTWFRHNYHEDVGEGASVTKSFIAKLIFIYIPSYLLFAPTRPARKLTRNIASITEDGKGTFHVSATRVPMFYAEDMDLDYLTYIFGVVIPSLVMGAIFGGLHLTLWSCFFQNELERWLWRSSALLITVEPFVALILILIAHSASTPQDDRRTVMKYLIRVLGTIAFAFSALIYVAARLILLYLSFCTLTTLGENVLCDVDWEALVPHVF